MLEFNSNLPAFNFVEGHLQNMLSNGIGVGDRSNLKVFYENFPMNSLQVSEEDTYNFRYGGTQENAAGIVRKAKRL